MFEQFKNMDRQTRLALAVAVIVSILAFGAVAGVIRQSGWNEGFLYGLTASGGETAKALTPYLANRGGYGPHGWHPFGFIGGLFHILFLGFLVLIFLKFLGFLRWRMHGGQPWGGHGPWGQAPWQQGPGGQSPAQPQPTETNTPPAGAAQPVEDKPQNVSWTRV